MTGERDSSGHQTTAHRCSQFYPDSRRGVVRFDGGVPPERDRHRILRKLRAELARHPAVRTVEGEPPDAHRELRGALDPEWFGRSSETASLRVTWIPDPSPGPEASDRTTNTWVWTPIRAYYTLHYSEPDGFDCRFHCEPNPHVDGLLHYQVRENVGDAYTYESVSFSARSATGLLWEMLDALSECLVNSD